MRMPRRGRGERACGFGSWTVKVVALVQRRWRRVRLWVVWEWVRVGREGWVVEVGGRRRGVEGEVRREAVRMER